MRGASGDAQIMKADSTRRPHFRSLAAEIGPEPSASVAGFHDFEVPFVVASRAGTALVAQHESIHDELLTNSAFGTLQRIFKKLCDKTAAGSPLAQATTATFEDLLQGSTLVHECTATYLAIKSLPATETDRVLKAHPKQYQEFHRQYSKVLEPALSATFVQYLAAKAIAFAAMSPSTIMEFTKWTPNNRLLLPDTERPDYRFSQVSTIVSSAIADLHQRLETVGNFHREIPSDFNCELERAWEELPPESLDIIQDIYWDTVQEWVFEKARKVCSIISTDDANDAFIAIFAALEKQSGIQLLPEFVAAESGSQARADALGYRGRFGAIAIDNPGAILARLPDLPEFVAPIHFGNATRPTIVHHEALFQGAGRTVALVQTSARTG
jgi:hypothetical protein